MSFIAGLIIVAALFFGAVALIYGDDDPMPPVP